MDVIHCETASSITGVQYSIHEICNLVKSIFTSMDTLQTSKLSSYFRNAYLSLLPIAVFSFPRQSCDFCALREVTLFLNLCPRGHKMPLKYLSFHCVLHCCREREMFYLTMHSTHFIYGYMASDIWLRTILIVRNETRCCHIGYSYRLTARVLLYAPSHRQDKTYHSLCYTSRGALAGTKNSSMGPPHEGSIRRPTAP